MTLRQITTLLAAGVTILLWPLPATALEWNLHGFGSAWYFSSSRDLDEEEDLVGATLQPNFEASLSPHLALFAEGRLIARQPQEEIYSSLREGRLDFSWRNLDLRIGRQLVQWGRADTINPTDNLTPSDYTLPMVEDQQLKTGLTAVKATYYLDTLSLSGIWAPVFRPSKIPLPFPRELVDEILPDTNLRNGLFALKIDRTAERLDWSLSFVDGFDLLPDFAPRDRITLNYPRCKIFGADFATTLGQFGVRGEAAYFLTADTSGEDPFRKNPFFYYVLGVDRAFADNLYLNLQFIQRIVQHFRDPHDLPDPQQRSVALLDAVINNQLDRVSNAISAKLEYRWWYDTLKTEISGIYNLTRHDYLLRPRVAYALSDTFTLTVGGDLYRGKNDSFFGAQEDNSTLFVEFKIGF